MEQNDDLMPLPAALFEPGRPSARDVAADRWLARLIEGVAGRRGSEWAAGADADRPALPQHGTQQDREAGTGEALRVWVIDDDAIVALYLTDLLQDQGHVVTTFSDARLALQAYQADPQSVDVVVTDQRMPALSGDVLARALLRERPRLRVILCTGYSDRIDERGALALGIQHFFRKPFDARALLRAVRGEPGSEL